VKRLGGLALLALLSGCLAQVKPRLPTNAPALPDNVAELVKLADDTLVKANANAYASTDEMEYALSGLDKARTLDPQSYEVAWKAAHLCAWIADDQYDDKSRRASFSSRGADYAKAAVKLNPKGVEGHYYSGINQGFSATTKLVGAKFMVPAVRDEWKKAMQIDSSFDHGGPPRSLGALYSEAPPWPASIGDPDKGVELLQMALKTTNGADWPLNELLLGNALVKAEKYDEAKQHYQKVLVAQATPEDAHFLPKWQQKAKKGIADAAKAAASAGAQ
jgi:tetratricopeptide (TPR) repeat protein